MRLQDKNDGGVGDAPGLDEMGHLFGDRLHAPFFRCLRADVFLKLSVGQLRHFHDAKRRSEHVAKVTDYSLSQIVH